MRDEGGEGIQSCSKLVNTAIITWYLPGSTPCQASAGCLSYMPVRADGDLYSFCAFVSVFCWKRRNNARQFAQKNNNRSSARVTLRCGLLFASSVITGQSQRAVREALQMTMWCMGVMERFSKAWDSSALPLMVLAGWISTQIIICTGRTKMTLSSLLLSFSKEKKVISFWLLLFFPMHSRAIRRRHKPVCLAFCSPASCTEGPLFLEFASRPNIYMRNHNCTAWEGKHPRLGCKIAALLASVIIPKLLRLWRRVCVFGRTDFWTPSLHHHPPCLCFLMMSRAGFGCAEPSGANS